MTTLIACSHGTASEAGRATVAGLVELVRRRIPATRVVQAFVDVQEPDIVTMLEQEAARDEVVVVPLLLSVGFHTAVDIAQAVGAHANARQTEPLGTHPLIADVLATRLRAAVRGAWLPGDRVVLAAAGSSNPAAVADVAITADHLRRRIPAPVSIGYASAIEPRIDTSVDGARADHGADRIIAASHVLAPGYFAGLVEKAGADLVSAPLGIDSRIADVIIERFRAV